MKEFDKAKKYVYNLLRLQPRTERELSDKLKGKRYAERVIAEVLDFFKGRGEIDDEKYARMFVENRNRLNPKGALALKEELIKKGVSAALAKRVVSACANGQRDTALRLAKDKLDELKTLPRARIKKRIYDHLARRGFDFDIIEEVLNECVDQRTDN